MTPVVLAAVLAFSSCAVTGESALTDVPARSEITRQTPIEPAIQAPPEEPAPVVSEDEAGILDPLAEVHRLWSAGLYDEARRRFWESDVRALSQGNRASEWALWRGRLYTERWKGADLGLAGENVSALLYDVDDVWAGTWTGGTARLSGPLDDASTWDPGRPSLAVRTVNRIRRDGGSIWVVRYGALERYDLRTSDWYSENHLPVTERLQDVVFTGNDVYLGTLGKGLWKKSGRSWEPVRQPGLFITRLEKGNGSEILICTMDRGLYIYEPTSDTWTRPPEGLLRETNVTSALVYGDLVIGGTYGSGAFVWNRSSSEVRLFGEEELGDSWILTVAVSGDWIYFGTFGAGVRAWNPSTGVWDSISLPEGLPSADIAVIETGEENSVWVGTLGGGIIRIGGGIHGD